MFLRKVREDVPLQTDHVRSVSCNSSYKWFEAGVEYFGLPSKAEQDWQMFATKNSTKKQVVILFHLQTSFL